MSEFEEVLDDECVCPYCGLNYQVESEDYDSDIRVDTCYGCGKKYYMSQEYTVETRTTPNCELNDEEHKYEPSPSGNVGYEWCSVCGDIRMAQ